MNDTQPKWRLVNQHCMTIMIVGTFTKGQFDPRIDVLMERIKLVIDETLPDFVPAHNAVTINVAQLAERGD